MSLAVRNLRAGFGKVQVLDGVSLDVAAGETLVLFGPSGAGKTVLLRAIAGLMPGVTGDVVIAGRNAAGLPPERRGLGMAFQNFALYPHMSARQNIASPLEARGLPAAEVTALVEQVAALLRIGHVLGQAPRELSNGQKQRTALARALVGEPRVLLLDDPLRNVDAKLRYEMRLELPRLLRRAGAATIYVTQDFREAMALGDRVAVLAGGKLVQDALPEDVYDAPATMEVARLFGDPPMNLLPATVMARGAGFVLSAAGWRLAFAGPAPAAPLLGIRPERVQVLDRPAPGAVPAEIVAVTPLHERQVVLLRAAGTEVVASLAAQPPQGEAWIAADPATALLFDAGGQRINAHPALSELVA